MNGVLLWIAGLIVALLAALFAVPYAVDWNSYRGVFEEEASRMLGREVRVGGNVSLRLLPAPYVRFERPRIADERGGEAFFRAESFTMWLALPQLVQGILEAKQIELKRPALRLQIDRDGGGNWSSFRIRQAALPFVPRGVSLQSVKVSEGVLALHGVDGELLTRIEIPDSELSAPALEGPYKLRANVSWNGETREVRASTAAPDPDGSTRLKLAIRALQSGNAYTFDGRVTDLANRPQFDGTLTAAIPVSGDTGQLRPTTSPGETATAAATPVHGSAFEVRAALKANAISAKLSDLGFSFEQNGQPQLLTGTAEASWHARPIVRANLTSHWLDLDRIAGLTADANALDAVRRLTASLTGYLPTRAEVAARITVDQANMAGDVVSGLVVAIENAGQGLTIKELRAALPGGSRVDVAGSLTGAGTAEAFAGDILVRGANLGRFLAWAARGSQLAEAKSDSGFSLSAHMKLRPGGLELRDASLDSGLNRLTGDLTYRWQGRRQLALSIETAHADISAVLLGALGPDLLKAKLGALTTAGPGAQLSSLVPHLAGADARLRIRADVLTDGTRILHDVDADITISDGSLKIPSLRVSTPEGFTLDLDGEVGDLSDHPDGAIHGVLAASTPTALAEAVDIGAPELSAEKRQWLTSLAPLRLAFASRFGQHGKTAAEISVDGMVHGEPLVGTLLLEGGLGNWRDAPVDMMLTSDSPDVARVVRGLLLGGARNAEQTEKLKGGTLLMKAAGTPASDAAVLIQLSGKDLQFVLSGRGALPGGKPPSFAGEMEIKSFDASRSLRFAGLPLPARSSDAGFDGNLTISLDEAGLTFGLDRLEVGGSKLSGEARLSGPESTRKLDLDLTADHLALPSVIALALDRQSENARVPEVAELLQWRDQPFDFSNLENVNGHVRLRAKELALGEGFGLSDAILEADVAPGQITVTKLEGKALGGAVSGAFKLEKTAAGAEISGALGLWDIRLDRITGASDAPIGAGRLQLTLQLSGQAVTPRALIPVLTGKGELELKAARWERLSPGAIETAADAVLTGRTAPTSEPLRQALRSALTTAPLPLGNRKIAVEVGEGAIKIGTFSIETPQARVTNRTTIGLTEFKIDSEWKLEAKAARGSDVPLPGISVIYVGPLKSLASLEPQLVMDALERELAVRGMERNVEHLERLRREDEARAKAEAERLKALELEQLQQMQGAGAQPPTIDVPFPFPASPPSAVPAAPQHMTIEPGPPLQPRPTAPWPGAPKEWNSQWPPPERSGT